MISSLIYHSITNVCALLHVCLLHDMNVYYIEFASLHSSSSHNLPLPSFMTNHWIFNRSNTTGATSGAGYVHPYGTFCVVYVAQYSVFCVVCVYYCLFFCPFLLDIVLFVLPISGYFFIIFKHFVIYLQRNCFAIDLTYVITTWYLFRFFIHRIIVTTGLQCNLFDIAHVFVVVISVFTSMGARGVVLIVMVG